MGKPRVWVILHLIEMSGQGRDVQRIVAVCIELECIAGNVQIRGQSRRIPQRAAQEQKSLAQALAGGAFGTRPPKQPRKRLAAVSMSGLDGQIGQQRANLVI